MRFDCIGTSIDGEIDIEAPPEKVFDAFTDPEQLAQWWGSEDTYRTSNWQVDLRPGGAWSCDAINTDGTQKSTVHGTYVAVDRPRVLEFTWKPSWDPIGPTNVRLVFEPIPTGTRLRLLHTGFEGFAESQKGHTNGWTRVLGWLRDKVQTQGAKA